MEAGAWLLLDSSDFPSHPSTRISLPNTQTGVAKVCSAALHSSLCFSFWPRARGAKLKQSCYFQHLPLKKPSNQPHTHHLEPGFELASSCRGCRLPDPGPGSVWLSLGMCFPSPPRCPFVPVLFQNSWEGPHLLGCREPTQGDIRGKNSFRHP